jgi:hypothetical protein
MVSCVFAPLRGYIVVQPPLELKNEISHRGKATKQLLAHLKTKVTKTKKIYLKNIVKAIFFVSK